MNIVLTPFGSGTASPLRGAEINCLLNVLLETNETPTSCRGFTHSGVIANPDDTSAREASSHLATMVTESTEESNLPAQRRTFLRKEKGDNE